MSKTYLFSFIFFLLSLTTQAQTPEFKVISFKNEANNIAARVNERLDVNDNACALIQVRLAETGVSFSANTGIVGNVERKGGDYWLFVSEGTRSIKIWKDGIKTTEYQLNPIPKSHETYILEVEVIRPEPKVAILPVNIITTPENADLTIDGKEYTNTKNIKLFPQLLNIKVTMPKAEDLEKQIVLKRNDTINIDLYPDAATATLQIAVTPFDTEIELTGDTGEYNTAKV